MGTYKTQEHAQLQINKIAYTYVFRPVVSCLTKIKDSFLMSCISQTLIADQCLVLVIRKTHNDKDIHELFQINVCFINHKGIYLFLENSSKCMSVAFNLAYALVHIGIHSP